MLEVLIPSKTRRKIITVFTKYPDYKNHVRGLAAMIKEDPGNVQRELKRMEQIGFVKASKQSNTNVYTANQKFSMYRELQSIVLKSQAKKKSL
ncbi:MAG TPA: ArsR family transcriptional regulator [Candidatus Saccharimonadales bacterium]|nr:ArsR family transcriptional regulator [Candidatus Saccharimonadales bacterium]